MARTESKTLTCHPAAEREIVEVHEKFHWSLTNSQDVKTVNQGLEKGGWLDDNVYSVRRTEHYVKLTFSREIDLPNLGEIKKLENAYFGLPTGDAIFAQRPLLEVLKEHGCNYLFQLKENQGDAYETVEYCF
ncbi:MAG: hypothetical protein FWE95_09150, partial [Planctomycetaceae bacterium]|nr:hypothetical protein [Planctomycetaceae bacterium]